MITTAVESLVAIIELAEAIRRSLTGSKRDHRLVDEIYKALRQIYFMPDGVLSLLKDFERGKKFHKAD